jgi:hypothetical protein
MWEPQCLTALWAFMACYRESFIKPYVYFAVDSDMESFKKLKVKNHKNKHFKCGKSCSSLVTPYSMILFSVLLLQNKNKNSHEGEGGRKGRGIDSNFDK